MNKDFGRKNVDRNVYIQPEDDGDDTQGHIQKHISDGATPVDADTQGLHDWPVRDEVASGEDDTQGHMPIVRGVEDEGDDTEGHILKRVSDDESTPGGERGYKQLPL